MSHLYNHIQRHSDAPVTELHRGDSESSSRDASTISEITLEQGLKPPPYDLLPANQEDDSEDVVDDSSQAMLKTEPPPPQYPEVGLKDPPPQALKDPPQGLDDPPPQRTASVGEQQQPEQSDQYEAESIISEDSSAVVAGGPATVASMEYSEVSSANDSMPEKKKSLPPLVSPIDEEADTGDTNQAKEAPESTPPRSDRKYRWYIGIAVVVAIIAIVVAVVVVVVTRSSGGDGDSVPAVGGGRDVNPTEAPDTTTAGPTTSPSSFPTTSAPTTNEVEAFLISKAFDGGVALATPGTPQNRAYDWLMQDPLIGEGSYNTLQRYALATLYYATGGDTTWLVNNLWLSMNNHVCEWNNTVSLDTRCSDDGKVLKGLSLVNNQLSGSLPPELALATEFIFLELEKNQLKGELPVEYFTSMPNLFFLNCYLNSISGTLPTEIGLSTALSYVDLDSNSLSGTIPSELGSLSDLGTLWLNNNNFVGTIPSELGNLVSLEALYLGGNNLNGTVPDELCSLPELSVLSVGCDVVCSCCTDECEASGPDAEALLTVLASIAFDGGVALATNDSPQKKAFNWLGNRPSLPSLSSQDQILLYSLATFFYSTGGNAWINTTDWLKNEDPCTWFGTDGSGCATDGTFAALHLRGDNLIGTLPLELAHISTLQSIDVKQNSLLFSLPAEYFTNLQLLVFDVFNNFLTGLLPTELGLQTSLVYLDIDTNSFQTTLPSEMGLLSSVEVMWLNNNLFTGTVPTELSGLPALSELYLSGNGFVGEIPLALCNLTLLEKLESDCDLSCDCCTNECAAGVTRPPITSPASDPPTPSPTTSSPTDLSLARVMDVLTIASFDGGTSLATDDTPQNQAFNWLLNTADVSILSDERLTQRYALAALYYSTNGPGWRIQGGWLTDANECAWFTTDDGTATCSSEGQLINLDLDNYDMAGPIPAEIGLLTNLLSVDFFNNFLTGTIPKEFGRLTELTEACDFDSNALTGPIPTEFGNFSKLKTMWLNDNAFSSTVPTEMGLMASLDQLYLHQNNGIFGSIPAELCAVGATTIQVDCDTLLCSCCQPSCVL